MIRILIADDQRLFAENLRIVIDTQADDLSVVDIALSGSAAIERTRALHPDVVLLDVRMPDTDGVQAARIIKSEFPNVKVLMLTTFDDDEYVWTSIRYGASGYLLKNMTPQRLFSSIRAVVDDTVLVSPAVAHKLFENPAVVRDGGTDTPPSAPYPGWLAELSRRECCVLQLIVRELSNREIAQRLFLSEKTVKNYVSAIYGKIGVQDRLAAIRAGRTVFPHLERSCDSDR